MKGFKIIIGFVTLINICFCWWDTGHMLVAKVAELTLLEEDSEAYDLANNITSILNKLSHGRISNFVESACWPDDLKAYSLQAMDDWHYINVPVNLTSVLDYINITSTPDDALGVLVRNILKLFF